MAHEPTIEELTREAPLCWFDDTVQKHPGEVVIHPETGLVYDFARAVKHARRTGCWRGQYGCYPSQTLGEWAVAVVLAEVEGLRKGARRGIPSGSL